MDYNDIIRHIVEPVGHIRPQGVGDGDGDRPAAPPDREARGVHAAADHRHDLDPRGLLSGDAAGRLASGLADAVRRTGASAGAAGVSRG